jgi:solute:Na+ symporter, SSS family
MNNAVNTAHGSVFNALDWWIIVAFAAAMIVVVMLSMRKKSESGKDYFLSGKDSNWLQIGTSIFSSNIGSEHLVGLAGAGFATGMAMAHWEMQGWIILVLGWVFVPLYDRMKVFTMPEFLELRFSRGSRSILSVLTVASLVLTKIAATIYAGDVVVRTLLGVDSVSMFGHQVDIFWVIALGLAFTTGLYTVLGGLRVIMYTAVLQTPVLIFGSVAILIIGLQQLGGGDLVTGWNAMVHAAGHNIHLMRPAADPEWSWLAVIPGSMIIGFWYWCTDQYIVQRVLAGKNQKEGRRGAILGGALKLTPVFIFLIPGMIAFALNSMPSSGFHTSGDAAYTSLVGQILPHGVRGFVACGMIVALMASLGSKFNASATLFTMDFYRYWRPKASGIEEVITGRIATAAIVVLGILWVLVIKMLNSNLYEYLQNVQSYLSPAIVVLFVGGVFWKRATAPAAFWSFLVGVVGGFARLFADIAMRGDKAAMGVLKQNFLEHKFAVEQNAGAILGGGKDALAFLKQQLYQHVITLDQYTASVAPLKAKFGVVFDLCNVHWLFYCQSLLVLTAGLMIVISLLTKAPDAGKLKYSWYGATAEDKAATRASWNALDVIYSALVVLLVVAFYYFFW